MRTRMRLDVAWAAMAFLATALAGCGSSDSGSLSEGTISVLLTDSPIAYEHVDNVFVEFSGVSLKPESGREIVIDFDDDKTIDLLTLTNGAVAPLLEETLVPAGPYEWIRLAVNAAFDNVFDSYVMMDDGSQLELQVPSGAQTGLKLVSGFTVIQGGTIQLVIDWDLRKALVDPVALPGLFLVPALRVTDMSEFGTLVGTVSSDLVMSSDTETCTNDLAMDTGNAVYIYKGSVGSPGDMGDAETPPFVTQTVSQQDGTYVFEVHFMPIGDFTAAFTCQASDDFPDTDEEIDFRAVAEFSIEHGMETEVNF